MIVPQTRLLLWVGGVAVPAATLGALAPEALPTALALVGLLLAVAVLDGVLAFGRMDGLALELAEVVRWSKDREAQLELRVRNEHPKRSRQLRLGLPLPREIESPQEDLTVTLPADSEWSRLPWPCTPRKRGNFRLDRCHVEAPSLWGFWAVRAALPVQCEIRVYPNLMTERKSVAALFLNRGTFGIHAMRQVGKGRDFEKLREYIPGDSFEDIHWKATARRGRPVTKLYQIERTQEVYVIIDASRLSAREAKVPDNRPVLGRRDEDEDPDHAPRTTPHGQVTSVLERYLTAGLVLGLAAEQQGDLFGLTVFSDRIERFVRAKNGKAHYGACRDALYTLEPRVATPDFEELCAFLRVRLRKRALLIFLTALDDPVLSESFARNIELISRQHLVMVNMMQPPGVRPLFSDAPAEKLDDLYSALGGHIRWHDLRELEKVLKRRGVTFNLVENERLSAQLVTQYLTVKQRQLI
jgi:uncharacterized protein (DUF58 family)